MPISETLKLKIFADGADVDGIRKLAKDPLIAGFTTNPTLMKAAGVTDYEVFGREVLWAIPDKPVSFEVFADDFDGMVDQARTIASWGPNVNVKIPATTTTGEFCGPVIRRLSGEGIAVNVTAVMTPSQVAAIVECLDEKSPAIISVFAGRIADTGRDPVPVMQECLQIMAPWQNAQLLWASPREVLNAYQADEIGCHIITMTGDLLAKLKIYNKDLDEYSLETVRMFHRDATDAGYSISIDPGIRAAG